MARGKKYSDEIKEKAYYMYAVSQNIREVARNLSLSPSTVKSWIDCKARAEPDEFEQLRTQKKHDFIEMSSSIIDKGLELIDRRITIALEKQDELEHIIHEIELTSDDEISTKQKQAAITAVKEVQLQKIRDVTTAIGTLYDKRALAQGDSTSNTAIEIKLPQEADEYAE